MCRCRLQGRVPPAPLKCVLLRRANALRHQYTTAQIRTRTDKPPQWICKRACHGYRFLHEKVEIVKPPHHTRNSAGVILVDLRMVVAMLLSWCRRETYVGVILLAKSTPARPHSMRCSGSTGRRWGCSFRAWTHMTGWRAWRAAQVHLPSRHLRQRQQHGSIRLRRASDAPSCSQPLQAE